MEIRTTKEIDKFSGYDRTLAICHMDNFGIIYFDEYNMPLEIEEVYSLGLED